MESLSENDTNIEENCDLQLDFVKSAIEELHLEKTLSSQSNSESETTSKLTNDEQFNSSVNKLTDESCSSEIENNPTEKSDSVYENVESEENKSIDDDNATPPINLPATTDEFPCLNDANDELNRPDKVIKFFIDTNLDENCSVAIAEYEETKYQIGFLDLTPEEYACLLNILETVELCVNPANIWIHHNKFNIKRINVRESTPLPQNQSNNLFNSLNLRCIQFSSTQPFIARYDDEFYFVGTKLHKEYKQLLKGTKKKNEYTIRIAHNLLICNELTQTLDMCESIKLKNQRTFCLSSGSDGIFKKKLYSQHCIYGYSSSEFRRYIITKGKRPKPVEIESKLLFSLNCDEICVYTEDENTVNNDKEVVEEDVDECDGEDDDDDDDKAFLNQLFTDDTPVKCISAPTDTFPSDCDSDNELDTEAMVKLYIDESNSMAVAKYEDIEYSIGFLDLSYEEYPYLAVIDWSIELNVNPKHILVCDNKLSIKRIKEDQNSSNQSIDLQSTFSKFKCIQFSSTEPLMAKYEDRIYMVGNKLNDEYAYLLNRFDKRAGTAIWVEKNQLIDSILTQTLDVHESVSFQHRRTTCIKSDLTNSSEIIDNHFSSEYHRFIVSSKDFFEVDPKLVHSIKCEEIIVYSEQEYRSNMPEIDETLFDNYTNGHFESGASGSKDNNGYGRGTNLNSNNNRDVFVVLYIDKLNSIAVAEYDGAEYRIEFLDLTPEEYSYLSMIENTVHLIVNLDNILLHRNKLAIKRINEPSVSPNVAITLWSHTLRYIQFSSTQPLMANYEGNIYIVGEKLCTEYSNLLSRTNKSAGTAIWTDIRFLVPMKSSQILDLHHNVSFECLNIMPFDHSYSELPDTNKFLYEFHRYMTTDNPYEFLKVDPNLIYPTKCNEIYVYAGKEYPFDLPEIEVPENDISANFENGANESKDISGNGRETNFIPNNNSEVLVTLNIDKVSSKAVAEYEGAEYLIEFLDLTPEEYSYLSMINSPVPLIVDSHNLLLHNNKLAIKRINERPVSVNVAMNLWSLNLNLKRIQFSNTKPLMAKYEGKIYMVGEKLCAEYSYLMNRIKKNGGIAIWIDIKFLIAIKSTKTVDLHNYVSFQCENTILFQRLCSELPDTNEFLDECQFHRYVTSDNQYELLKVDPNLIHSRKCDEIYVHVDENLLLIEPVSIKKTAVKNQNQTTKPDSQNDCNLRSMEEVASKNNAGSSKTNEENLESNEWCNSLRMNSIKAYAVPLNVQNAVINRIPEPNVFYVLGQYDTYLNVKYIRSTCEDYLHGYRTMIYLEEMEESLYVKRFDQKNIQITYLMERLFYISVTEELSDLVAAIYDNLVDRFELNYSFNQYCQRKTPAISGKIYRIQPDKITIEICSEQFRASHNKNKYEFYDISFKINRMPYQLTHQALDFIKSENLFDLLIRNNKYYSFGDETVCPASCNIKYEGTMMHSLNTEQQSAIKNIISKGDKLPYILFGPPGTGKTRTLVGLIEQIVRTTDKNVLVCATSNAACDEITERLIDVLKDREMFRMFASSCKYPISERIKKISNWKSGKYGDSNRYPELRYLYKFRVLVCTSIIAGNLTRARADRSVWSPSHFGYVLIDECASAPEPVSLVPVSGLCTKNAEVCAQIVLAGDPRQLDAVTKSRLAKRLGYNESWMEQLCKLDRYKRNKNTGQYNELYITQLIKNYRSHPEILRIPNELFYNNSLQALAKEENINWYINSEFLPSKQFPIVFKSVQGICQQVLDYSWYNEAEIDEVISTIKQLLPPHSYELGLKQIKESDIGVVTPYRKQRRCIVKRLRRLHFNDVTVGTAEIFQGKEKPVMIISTVRSNGGLGFVAEPRRMNVIITRAKSLIVIIGDPHTLQLDAKWLRLIEHCIKNNSFIQGQYKFMLKSATKDPLSTDQPARINKKKKDKLRRISRGQLKKRKTPSRVLQALVRRYKHILIRTAEELLQA